MGDEASGEAVARAAGVEAWEKLDEVLCGGSRPVEGAPVMIIAVASGKGGTGKTTVATNLVSVAETGSWYADCDVEAPNGHLFLAPVLELQREVEVAVPLVDVRLCDGCGLCQAACRFNAIAVLPGGPLVFEELCHGCGGCALACPTGAIKEKRRRIGMVEKGLASGRFFVQGRLDVGEPMSPPVIRAVRDLLPEHGTVIVDAPPGTSCPVITAIAGTDVCLLVTEPTPFGLHDLSLAVGLVDKLGIPCGVVINRHGIGDDRVDRFCAGRGLPVLARIPDQRAVAEAYSDGRLAIEAVPGLRSSFLELLASARGLARQDQPVEQVLR